MEGCVTSVFGNISYLDQNRKNLQKKKKIIGAINNSTTLIHWFSIHIAICYQI